MGFFRIFTLASLGIYKGLTLIGIAVGIFLFLRGVGGNSIPAWLTVLLGIFVILKELLDMVQYASPLNFVGVGVGVFVFARGVTGNGLGSLLLVAVGSFVVFKECVDLLHSGH